MRNTIRRLALIALALLIASVAFATGDGEDGMDGEPKGTVSLVYMNWEEGVAWTHMLATVLEDELGYDVNLTAADVGPAYQSVAQGDQDFIMEAWLPNLHAPYLEELGDQMVEVSVIYEDGVTGLIVPQYMADAGVTTLSDLADPEVAEQLDYKITGIDAGAGMMIKTEEELIPGYGLDDVGYELVASSSPAMMAAIDSAIQNEEFIVGMGWQPHSMFGRYDLVILEQDEEQIWSLDDIKIMGRLGVEDDLPEVVEFFENVLWTNETIGPLMVHIADSNLSTLEAAREWKNENPDIWQDWLPE